MGPSIKLKIILLTACLIIVVAMSIGFAVHKYTLLSSSNDSNIVESARRDAVLIVAATVFFALSITVIFALKIVEPVDELIIGTQLVANGRLDYRIRRRSSDEIGRLVDSFNHMIKQLKRSQQKSSEYSNIASVEKHKAELIIDSMADGVIVTDQEHRIVLLNPAAETLFEFNARDYMGKSIMTLLKKYKMEQFFKDYPEMKDAMLPDPKPGTVIREFGLSKHGSKVIKATLAPLKNYSNVVIGTVVVIEDVTKLRQLDEMKTDFVSTVSHELRTPLTSIKGYASLLADGKLGDLNEKQKRSAQIIDHESDRLTDLINDILDLSRLESGKGKAKLEEHDIRDCLENARVLEHAKEKGIKVVKLVPKSVPPVPMDRNKIIQVFNNLVSNAIKFTPAGGKITIKVTSTKDLVKVDIIDTGIGIPKRDIPNLFNKFYQVESHLTRNQGGTGLGLPIVKEIIGLHHGLISICSKPRKGTTVSFALPISGNSGKDAPKCWEVRNCQKVKCPAYQSTDKRCWLYMGTHCTKQSNQPHFNKIDVCRYCDVYKVGIEHDEDDTDSG